MGGGVEICVIWTARYPVGWVRLSLYSMAALPATCVVRRRRWPHRQPWTLVTSIGSTHVSAYVPSPSDGPGASEEIVLTTMNPSQAGGYGPPAGGAHRRAVTCQISHELHARACIRVDRAPGESAGGQRPLEGKLQGVSGSPMLGGLGGRSGRACPLGPALSLCWPGRLPSVDVGTYLVLRPVLQARESWPLATATRRDGRITKGGKVDAVA